LVKNTKFSLVEFTRQKPLQMNSSSSVKENKPGINRVKSPMKERKRTASDRKILSPTKGTSPSPKKMKRRVSFAPSKTVYQEEKPVTNRLSLIPQSRDKKKLVIPDEPVQQKPEPKLEPKPIINTRNSVLDAENLAAFQKELENLSDSSFSSLDSSIDISVELGKDKSIELPTIPRQETSTLPDFGKIIADAKEQLKKHKEQLNSSQTSITTRHSLDDSSYITNVSNFTDMSQLNKTQNGMDLTAPIGSIQVVNANMTRTINLNNMSMTGQDYGQIEPRNHTDSLDLDALDQSRMSLAPEEFGRIQDMHDSTVFETDKSSAETNDFKSRKSVVGDVRMSLTGEDFGLIESVRKSLAGRKSMVGDERMSLTQNDIEIQLAVGRKSMVGTEDMEFSGELPNFNSRKSIVGDHRMSLTTEGNGFIEQVKDKTVNDFAANRTLNFAQDMSLTDERLFNDEDDEEPSINHYDGIETFERPDDLLRTLKDDPLTMELSLELERPQFFKSPRKEPTITQVAPPLNITVSTTPKRLLPMTLTTPVSKENTPSQKLIKSVLNLSAKKRPVARSLNEKINAAKDETQTNTVEMTPMKRIQKMKRDMEEETQRENSRSIDVTAMTQMTVADFLYTTNIRFLDDLSNQKRPTSSIGFAKSLYDTNLATGRILSSLFVGAELEAYEKASNEICDISEGLKDKIAVLEQTLNRKNPRIFYDLGRWSKDEMMEFNKELKSMKQLCKVKADQMFIDWKLCLENNISTLMNNHLNHLVQDHKNLTEHIKYLDHLSHHVEIEIQKLNLKLNRIGMAKSQLLTCESDIERAQLDVLMGKQKYESTKRQDDKLYDTSLVNQILLKSKEFFALKRLGDHVLILENESMECDLIIEFDHKIIKGVQLNFAKTEGDYCEKRDALIRVSKIMSLLQITQLGQVPEALQQVTYRLGRIQLILKEFEALNRSKVLIRCKRETDQTVVFDFINMKTKESFSFDFNYRYPFMDWKTDVPCDFGRITRICLE
jgi:hypothetical protein